MANCEAPLPPMRPAHEIEEERKDKETDPELASGRGNWKCRVDLLRRKEHNVMDVHSFQRK